MNKTITVKELILLAKKQDAIQRSMKHETLYGRTNNEMLIKNLNDFEYNHQKYLYLQEAMVLATTQRTLSFETRDGVEEVSLWYLIEKSFQTQELIEMYTANKNTFKDQDDYAEDLKLLKEERASMNQKIDELTTEMTVTISI